MVLGDFRINIACVWLYQRNIQPESLEHVSSRGNTTSPQLVLLRGCQSAAGSNKAQ